MSHIIDPEKVATIVKKVAEDEILTRFGSLESADIIEKRPGNAGNLVTTADIEAEKILTRELETSFPGTLAIGEETIENDPSILKVLDDEAPVWLIDPVDGTSNFAAGKEPFTVLVSLIMKRESIFGLIYSPKTNEMAIASKGEGAFCNGTPIRVASSVSLEKSFGSAHASAWGREFRDIVRAKFEGFAKMVNYHCAGFDFLRLACGDKHFSLYRTLHPWDHAAGVLLHKEAGGYSALLNGDVYSSADKVYGLLTAPNEEVWNSINAFLRPHKVS